MKERLTGAIILVALLVLLVPELLTGPESSSPAKPAGPEGAPFRSYTIDLADDAARSPPATVPTTDEPVATAKPDAEANAGAAGEQNEVPVDESAAASATGPARGSGADPSAAGPAARPDSGTPASAEPERPQSAFGPNAVNRARSGSDKAPAKAAVAKADAPKPPSVKSDAASAEPPRGESARAGSARVVEGSKGWAIQLGVFASRDNAERLAKQVKGKGYPVVVNEIPGNGKRLYRVRVGPEADRDAAAALGAKLRAAGHGGTVVPYP